MVPERDARAFATALRDAAARLYPRIAGNPDYTAVISERHFARLTDAVAEAARAGTTVLRHPEDSGAGAAGPRADRRMPPVVVLDPPEDSALMQDEIFGPVLVVRSYRTLDAAIAYVNARPRPLALYCCTSSRATERHVLARTLSGGVTVNGTLLHCAQPDLPFGGIGESGFGAYHGEAGFRRFSHERAVYRPGPISGFTAMTPPHGRLARLALELMLRRPGVDRGGDQAPRRAANAS